MKCAVVIRIGFIRPCTDCSGRPSSSERGNRLFGMSQNAPLNVVFPGYFGNGNSQHSLEEAHMVMRRRLTDGAGVVSQREHP
jgi:hypothetical protein